MKKGILVLIVSLLVLTLAFAIPLVELVDPTLPNATVTPNTSVEINYSIEQTEIGEVIFNWDGTNFTLFNESLNIFYNFDNRSALGENDRILFDLSGTGHNSTTFVSDPQPNASGFGRFGSSYEFDGNDRIEISYGDELRFVEEQKFTMAFWLYLRELKADQGMVSIRSGNGIIFETKDTNRLRSYISGDDGNSGNFYTETNSMLLNTWQHIAMVSNGTNVYFFINGLRNGSMGDMSGVGNLTTDSDNIDMGYYNGYMNGSLDEFMLFNATLSDEEINQLYMTNLYKFNTTQWYLYVNQSQSIESGLNNGDHTYQSFVSDKSGGFNISVQREVTVSADVKVNLVLAAPHENRHYISPVDLNITTNFLASCLWSNNTGITNYSMSTSDSLTHTTSATLEDGKHLINFYCNDSLSFAENQTNIIVDDHIMYFVDNESATCDDSIDKWKASNESTPYCTINSGALSNSDLVAGDEIVIMEAVYCEQLDISNTNIDGLPENPIIVRGEADDKRAYLNGTCGGATEGDAGIPFTKEDYWKVQYFFVYNFSGDGISAHATTGNNSLGLILENITIYKTGFDGEGVSGGAYGDGISFHENCTGEVRNINITGTYKSGIVDIHGASVNYTDIYIEGSEDIGIWFVASGYGTDIAEHYLENIMVVDNPYCFRTNTNATIKNLTCLNNNEDPYQILIESEFTNITLSNFSGTNETVSTIRMNGGNLELSNSWIDKGVNLTSNSNATFLNVTYDVTEEFVASSSELTREWFYITEIKNNNKNLVGDASLVIVNRSSDNEFSFITAANGLVSTKVIEYVNEGGTRAYATPHVITATYRTYSAAKSINFTIVQNKYDDVITLNYWEQSTLTKSILKIIVGFLALIVVVASLAGFYIYAKNNFSDVSSKDFIKYIIELLIAVFLFIALITYIITEVII